MRQTELKLSAEDISALEGIRSKGLHQSREVNRAYMHPCLDQGIPEAQIMAVLGIGGTTVWRTRAPYLHSWPVSTKAWERRSNRWPQPCWPVRCVKDGAAWPFQMPI